MVQVNDCEHFKYYNINNIKHMNKIPKSTFYRKAGRIKNEKNKFY